MFDTKLVSNVIPTRIMLLIRTKVKTTTWTKQTSTLHCHWNSLLQIIPAQIIYFIFLMANFETVTCKQFSIESFGFFFYTYRGQKEKKMYLIDMRYYVYLNLLTARRMFLVKQICVPMLKVWNPVCLFILLWGHVVLIKIWNQSR